tara:strand:- start:166 stop:918 length:753 start_codon:yes stop_codon:yes gene_type:complete
MAEYVKTIISALSSRSSDYSDPHVSLKNATQTQTDEKVVRVDGRLEANTSLGTSTLYNAYDFYNLSLQGLTRINTFILHNRSDSEMLLQYYRLIADLSGSTIGNCVFASNNQITTATANGLKKADFIDGDHKGSTHLNVYGAKSSNNNDLARITSFASAVSGTDRVTVSGTPFGTNETDDSGTIGIQFFSLDNMFVPAGGIVSLPGQLAKVKGNVNPYEISITSGFTGLNSNTAVTSAQDYTLFMSGTVG